MLKIDELRAELHSVLGDHAEIEGDVDNVQVYIDAIAVRRKVAPDIEECGWLMLLDLYKQKERDGVTAAHVCAASAYPTTTAIDHVLALVSKGLVARRTDPSDARRITLALTQQGVDVVSEWLAQMHFGARRQVGVSASSIVTALRTLPRQSQ